MLNELFSDYFTHRDNFLTRIDARVKMIFAFVLIIAALLSRAYQVPLVISLVCFICLLSIRIPFRIIVLRLSAPLILAAIILIIRVFFYHEDISSALLIIGKIIACVLSVMFLSMTTPLYKLLSAASYFKMPKTWIEITMITYRYVFVLLEDAITIRDAQKVRLGYSNLSRSVRSLTELVGSLFIRAYDQSILTSQAMEVRGKNGYY